MIPYKHASGYLLVLLGFLIVSPLSHAQEPKQEPQKPMVYEGTVGGLRILEEGQPPAMIHATVDAENGDKCAWISSGQGASAEISLSIGTFAVQSLWSNAFNGGSGGCVLSYP